MAARLICAAALLLLLAACGGDDRDPAPLDGGPPPGSDGAGFRSEPLDAYVKVDRMGGPATATALLRPGADGGSRRQEMNLTEPDADAQYAMEYIQTLRTLHYELAPVLAQLQLAACGVPGATVEQTDVGTCVAQAAPRVVPDVLRFDTSRPSGWPNGRDLDDPAPDRLLALGLLDLTDPDARCLGAACTIDTLANLPLNPPASVPPPLAQFPYFNNEALAPPP